MSGPCGHGFSIAGCVGCPLKDCDEAFDAIADAVRNSDFDMTGRDAAVIVSLLRREPATVTPRGDGRPRLTLVGTA
jgi:hypothetical protein